jgi:hypothetical protein
MLFLYVCGSISRERLTHILFLLTIKKIEGFKREDELWRKEEKVRPFIGLRSSKKKRLRNDEKSLSVGEKNMRFEKIFSTKIWVNL